MTTAEKFKTGANIDYPMSVKPFVRSGSRFVSGVVFQGQEFRCGEFDSYEEALAAAERAVARIAKRLKS